MPSKRYSLFPLLLAGLIAAPAAQAAPDIIARSAYPAASVLDATNKLGSWIWDAKTFDKQTCRLWRTFEIPAGVNVVRAQIRIAVDNGYHMFLDGFEIGQGSDWRTMTIYDVIWRLTPGTHVLAVEGFNDADKAGVIAGLHVEFADGRVLEVASDPSWRVVPNDEHNWTTKVHRDTHWPAATVVGRLGQEPWWSSPTKTLEAPPLMPVSVHFWESAWLQIALVLVSVVAALTSLRLMTKLAIQAKAQSLLQLERARIARDIHDDLGARLTQLLLAGEVAQSKLPAGSDTRLQFDRICENARDVLDAIDEVVWVVNSQRDTLGDFVNYVCKYAQSFLRSTPVRGRFDVEKDLPAVMLDLPIRRNLLLAVKEAISNAARHSEATEMFVRIRREGPVLAVIVEDNGKGFDPSLANAERNGLTNMAQRMKDLGGACQVISRRPGTGCRIELRLPLAQIHSHRRRFRWLFGARTAAPAQLPGQGIIPSHSSRT